MKQERASGFRVEPMASGSLSVVLQEPVSWEAFPKWADVWCRRLGATLSAKADSVDERVWSVSVEGNLYWLAYDDSQAALTLEPQQLVDDETIKCLAERLRNACGDREADAGSPTRMGIGAMISRSRRSTRSLSVA